jgi:hypothetical protein
LWDICYETLFFCICWSSNLVHSEWILGFLFVFVEGLTLREWVWSLFFCVLKFHPSGVETSYLVFWDSKAHKRNMMSHIKQTFYYISIPNFIYGSKLRCNRLLRLNLTCKMFGTKLTIVLLH